MIALRTTRMFPWYKFNRRVREILRGGISHHGVNDGNAEEEITRYDTRDEAAMINALIWVFDGS